MWQTWEMMLLAKMETAGGSATPARGSAVRRTRRPSVLVTVTVTVGVVVVCGRREVKKHPWLRRQG